MNASVENVSTAGRPALDSCIDLGEASSFKIFELMAQQAENPEIAMEALTELYRRIASRLICSAKKWEIYLGTAYDAESLVNEAFERIYKAAGSFKREPQPSPEKEDEKVLIWAFRILKNLILDYKKEEEAEATTQEPDPERKFEFRTRMPKRWKAYVKEFLKSLPAADADMLLTSYQYFNFVKEQCEVPDEIKDALFKQLMISEVNLRVKRNRLVARLKEFIETSENHYLQQKS
jgi:DNA-directed RNA polymerase specialized sigma24 family protein